MYPWSRAQPFYSQTPWAHSPDPVFVWKQYAAIRYYSQRKREIHNQAACSNAWRSALPLLQTVLAQSSISLSGGGNDKNRHWNITYPDNNTQTNKAVTQMQSSASKLKARSVKGQAEPGGVELAGCSLEELTQLRPTGIMWHCGPLRLLRTPCKGVLPACSKIDRSSRNHMGATSLQTIVELRKVRYKCCPVPKITDFVRSK